MKWIVVVLMGVSGCGKTTVGLEFIDLIQQHSSSSSSSCSKNHCCIFLDADDFHPEENIAKMRDKVPLTDSDRLPWLLRLNQEIKKVATTTPLNRDCKKGEEIPFVIVLACSALRRVYRARLTEGIEDHFVFAPLVGDFDHIRDRLEARRDHFFNKDLLRSQFDTLEDITPEEAQHYFRVVHLSLLRPQPQDEASHSYLPNELAQTLFNELFL